MRDGGGRGGHLPPADGHDLTTLATVPGWSSFAGQERMSGITRRRTDQANPFVLEARTAATCCLSTGCGGRATGPREQCARRPAPAGRGRWGRGPAARRPSQGAGFDLDLILIRVLPSGPFPQDRTGNLGERCTARDRCIPLGSDAVWTRRGPSRPWGRVLGPVRSGDAPLREQDPTGWLGHRVDTSAV